MKATWEKYHNWILIGVPIALFLILRVGFQFNGLYGQDSHTYYQYALELKDYLVTGTEPGSFHWTVTFPFIGALIGLTGFSVMLGMQLVSLFALIGVLYFGNKLITILFQRDGSLFLILGAATEVYFVRGGMLLMSDMLTAYFVLMTFYQYVKLSRSEKNSRLVYVLLFSLLAVATRYPALPLVILPVLYSVFIIAKRNGIVIKTAFLVAGLIAFILLTNSGFFWGIVSDFNSRWGFENIFSRTMINGSGIEHHWVPNAVYVFGNFMHFGYLSIGVLLLPFYKTLLKSNMVVLFSVLIYLVFLSGFSTQNYRFLILSHPLVLVVLFPAFVKFWTWGKEKRLSALFVIGTLMFNTAFFIYSFGKTYRVYRVEKEVVSELVKLNTDVTIYGFYVDQSFKSYGIENEIKNFYYEEYPTFEKGAIVVFNEQKFKNQWKDSHVMNNWNNLKANYELDTLVSLQDNWRIYRIK